MTASETITAIASATGDLQSAAASATYSSASVTANPVFSLAGGSYSGPQTLTFSDITSGASIYYTVDGSSPTTSSPLYAGAIAISTSEQVQALAVAPGLVSSATVSQSYTINPIYAIDYSQGFADAVGPVQFNGSTDLDDIRLQVTNGGFFESGSAFYATPVNIQSFTTDFTFQQSNGPGDGVTFTLQGNSPAALGAYGKGLGYAGIPNSIAIKFDRYNNSGEGPNSTGLYLNGAEPTLPAVNLTGTGIDLNSGDQIQAHLTYDGTTLTMTLTDAVTLATWSQPFTVNIPAIVGANTAYAGFTGGTGAVTSSQKFTYWTYVVGPPAQTSNAAARASMHK